MPKKIQPTKRQKTILVLHIIVFAIVNTIMWLTYDKGVKGWAYPWPAWITAAWALGLVGNFCLLFTTYEDPGQQEFDRQLHN